MGNTDDNKFDNFADIAGNYNILVPIIQRDYVQGSEVNKVNRDSFIRKILKKRLKKQVVLLKIFISKIK